MWEFLEYYQEEIEKAKYWLKVIFLSFLIILFIFLLIKTFYLNRPKIKPGEIAISYLKEAQSSIEKAENYLYPDLKKVKILDENYENLQNLKWVQKEKEGEEPIFEIKSEKIKKNKAEVAILEKTNKKEGWLFFEYKLPKEILFEVSLEKLGSWKKGYEWKIIEINSPDLIKKSKIGEKIEVEKGLFVKLINFEEYRPENLKIPEGLRIFSLEIEYENDSNQTKKIDSFGQWYIIDKEGEVFYSAFYPPSAFLRKPIFENTELKPGEKQRGYVTFEAKKEILPREIIYKDWERKIKFNL
jgi:membrane-associated HD superfamily phosphohydrolase